MQGQGASSCQAGRLGYAHNLTDADCRGAEWSPRESLGPEIGSRGAVKVIDFGVARARVGHERSRAAEGKIHYGPSNAGARGSAFGRVRGWARAVGGAVAAPLFSRDGELEDAGAIMPSRSRARSGAISPRWNES